VQQRAEGLAVFVLREWVVRANLVEDFISEISSEGFILLRHKILNTQEKNYVHDHLRGGTWGADDDGDSALWQPSAVLVLIDPESARLPASYATGFEHFRIRRLKERLRKKFDDRRSSVHSTDNSVESWDYIKACYPDEINKIKHEVTGYAKVSLLAIVKQFLNPKYLKHSLKHALRSFLIRSFLA
jgi:hypothetical protein